MAPEPWKPGSNLGDVVDAFSSFVQQSYPCWRWGDEKYETIQNLLAEVREDRKAKKFVDSDSDESGKMGSASSSSSQGDTVPVVVRKYFKRVVQQLECALPSGVGMCPAPNASGTLIGSHIEWSSRAEDSKRRLAYALVNFLSGNSSGSSPALTWVVDYPDHETLKTAFAHTELARLESSSEGLKFVMGLNLTAPQTLYPCHRHRAHELYVPLSTEAKWFQESNRVDSPEFLKADSDGWHPRAPFDLVFHDTNEGHGLKTAEEPLLNLWIQYGDLLADETTF